MLIECFRCPPSPELFRICSQHEVSPFILCLVISCEQTCIRNTQGHSSPWKFNETPEIMTVKLKVTFIWLWAKTLYPQTPSSYLPAFSFREPNSKCCSFGEVYAWSTCYIKTFEKQIAGRFSFMSLEVILLLAKPGEPMFLLLQSLSFNENATFTSIGRKSSLELSFFCCLGSFLAVGPWVKTSDTFSWG